MKKYNFYLLIFLFCLACQKPQSTDLEKLDYQHPIPFAPEQYVCYRSTAPLKIDGKADEDSWGNAPWTKTFVDIEGTLKPKPEHDTRVKMLWDDEYFYFFAQMDEPHVWAKLKQRDTVIFYDDDFEIFIDPDGDSHNYYEVELNAFNTLWELILLRPYRVDKKHKVLDNWNIPDIKTAVHVEGTLNNPEDEDEYWSTEIAIPWTALEEFSPRKKKPKTGDQWRVNFSRVDWTMNIEQGAYVKAKDPATNKVYPADNWVWSPMGFIAMHMPEHWGYVQFSNKDGKEQEAFVEHPDEAIKWALWQMYHQQIQFYKKEKRYSDDLNGFTIPVLENATCPFQPNIHKTPNLFEIIAASCEQDGHWSIRQDGMIEFFAKK